MPTDSSQDEATKTELFVDVNCPFCFCQLERIERLALWGKVRWRGINHAPALPIPPAQGDHEVTAELAQLRAREPDFDVRDPGFRPNSRPATHFLAAVRRERPDRFPQALLAVARSLWREGRDISSASVLLAIAQELGLAGVQVTAEAVMEEEESTRTWSEGPFDRRLPAARSPHGAVLLGLGDERRLQLFVSSGLFSQRGGDSC